jgi:hypothetical protein
MVFFYPYLLLFYNSIIIESILLFLSLFSKVTYILYYYN